MKTDHRRHLLEKKIKKNKRTKGKRPIIAAEGPGIKGHSGLRQLLSHLESTRPCLKSATDVRLNGFTFSSSPRHSMIEGLGCPSTLKGTSSDSGNREIQLCPSPHLEHSLQQTIVQTAGKSQTKQDSSQFTILCGIPTLTRYHSPDSYGHLWGICGLPPLSRWNERWQDHTRALLPNSMDWVESPVLAMTSHPLKASRTVLQSP